LPTQQRTDLAVKTAPLLLRIVYLPRAGTAVQPGASRIRYTRAHCRSLLPAAPGHVVVSHRGAGASTSRVFDITTTSWNLDYTPTGACSRYS
jgi:hypothetical protein